MPESSEGVNARSPASAFVGGIGQLLQCLEGCFFPG